MIIFLSVFFLQAEDGIRYLVRSRGLGDVYKRQRRDRDRDGGGAGPAGPRPRDRPGPRVPVREGRLRLSLINI